MRGFPSPGRSGWMVVTSTSLAMMQLVPSILAPLMVTPLESSSHIAGRQELVVLATGAARTVALRVGDDVGDEQVVVPDVGEIV